MTEDRPCFEVVNPETGHAYRIWPNGRVEGFPQGYGVFNRIPALIKAEQRAALERQDEGDGA